MHSFFPCLVLLNPVLCNFLSLEEFWFTVFCNTFSNVKRKGMHSIFLIISNHREKYVKQKESFLRTIFKFHDYKEIKGTCLNFLDLENLKGKLFQCLDG